MWVSYTSVITSCNSDLVHAEVHLYKFQGAYIFLYIHVHVCTEFEALLTIAHVL